MRLALLLVALACVAAVASGCSGPDDDRRADAAAAPPPPATAWTRTKRERRMQAVVRSWSARLNRGDNAGVARLFALPATLVQGTSAYRLVSRRQVALWHASLLCSGRVESITIRGRYATAVFRLADRGSRACDAPGLLVAARFEIVGGKIVSWKQVEVPAEQEPGPTA